MIQRAPSSERKTYVFDTNVLLYDPSAIFKFEEHEIVLPIAVIEELDRFKKDLNENEIKMNSQLRLYLRRNEVGDTIKYS